MPANFTEEERVVLKQNLLKNGYELLSKYGMKKLKISDIAKSVNIGTGTFYNFYPSKYEFIYELISYRKNLSLKKFNELSKFHTDGIPFDKMKSFLIENLNTNNIYRLLSQDDYNNLISKIDLPKENAEDIIKFGNYFMSKLKTDKNIDDFLLFSEAYKVIVIGTSDLTKLDENLLEPVLDKLVESACELLY